VPATAAAAAATVLALLLAGLAASVFHLGRPARGRRAASRWRTSWLSREVILLPALMAAVAAHALALALGAPVAGVAVRLTGGVAGASCLLLWWCTGMIYACLKMLQEWATPLTPLAFGALGLASGLGLAAAWFALAAGPDGVDASVVAALAGAAAAATGVASAIKGAWCLRHARLVPASTLHSALAIGRRHGPIRQLAMGMTGGSFNTREFFHGRSQAVLRGLPWAMGLLGAVLPFAAYLAAARSGVPAAGWLVAGVAAQLAGILAERWLFFAWARHPQNLYYQRVS